MRGCFEKKSSSSYHVVMPSPLPGCVSASLPRRLLGTVAAQEHGRASAALPWSAGGGATQQQEAVARPAARHGSGGGTTGSTHSPGLGAAAWPAACALACPRTIAAARALACSATSARSTGPATPRCGCRTTRPSRSVRPVRPRERPLPVPGQWHKRRPAVPRRGDRRPLQHRQH
jgi:hypothetical protein